MQVEIGDVVLIEYRTFGGEMSLGLFAVVYHERYDIGNSKNFTAIKISSKPYCYQVQVEQSYARFMNHEESFLNCNQLFRFRENEVRGVIGKLSKYYLNKINQQSKNYFKSIEKQLEYKIGKGNLFKEVKSYE